MTELRGERPDIIDLLCAIRDSDMDALKDFLAQGADVNGRNIRGVTPLAWAAGENKLDFVCVLLEAGAHVNVADDYGTTPLMKAAASGNIETVRLFVERGADIHAKADVSRATAERIAMTTGHTDIENFLRETAQDRARHAGVADKQEKLKIQARKLKLLKL